MRSASARRVLSAPAWEMFPGQGSRGGAAFGFRTSRLLLPASGWGQLSRPRRQRRPQVQRWTPGAEARASRTRLAGGIARTRSRYADRHTGRTGKELRATERGAGAGTRTAAESGEGRAGAGSRAAPTGRGICPLGLAAFGGAAGTRAALAGRRTLPPAARTEPGSRGSARAGALRSGKGFGARTRRIRGLQSPRPFGRRRARTRAGRIGWSG